MKEDKRRLILDNSLKLFVHKGYAATTTRDIAKRAGISAGLLFHYFPTKETILEELIDEASKGMELLLPFFENNRPDETFLMISNFITTMFNQNQSVDFFLLMSQTMALDCVSPHVRQKCDKSAYIHASAELIKEGQTLGIFKDAEALSLSYTFWGAVQGIAEMKYLYNDYQVPRGEVLYSILCK